MFGKFLLPLVCGLTLACARPIYHDTAPNPDSGNSPHSGDASSGSLDKLEKAAASLDRLGFKLSIVWIKNQTDEETGSFLLKFWRPNKGDQSPVLQDFAQTLNVRLWMPSMGHGASPVSLQHIDIGTYQVDDVYFSMVGDWEIQVDLKNGEELVDATQIPIHF